MNCFSDLLNSISTNNNNTNNIGIVQINPILGDIEYNAKKIALAINHAEKASINLIAFPELVDSAYFRASNWSPWQGLLSYPI